MTANLPVSPGLKKKKGALLLSGFFTCLHQEYMTQVRFSSFPQLLGLNADEPGHGAPAIAGPCLSKAPAGRKVW